MTICIAALAEDGERVVLAADQMVTASIPFQYEYESIDFMKIQYLADNAAALSAGNALFAAEILRNASEKITGTATVEQVAETVRMEYQAFRLNLLVNRYLQPRGITLADYYQIQNRLVLGVVQEIESNLTGFDLGVEMIVAGHTENHCRIMTITNPGILISHDVIGYVCAGSGGPHAMYYLIGSNYSKKMGINEVEKLVGEAKTKSEVAPGVGNRTVMMRLPKEPEAKTDA